MVGEQLQCDDMQNRGELAIVFRQVQHFSVFTGLHVGIDISKHIKVATAGADFLQKQVLKFGDFAYKGVEATEQEFMPIVQRLNTKLMDAKIELKVLELEDITQGIEARTLDFVATNPTQFLQARYRFEVTGALATLVRNHPVTPLTSLAGVILVRADNSSINSLTDLKERSVAAPGPEFMGGFRAQAYELHLAGVPTSALRLSHVGSHKAVVEAVVAGEVAAGFVRDGFLEGMAKQGKLDLNQIKIINGQYRPDFPHLISTRLHPEWPVFALPHVSDAPKRQVTAAMLALDLSAHQLMPHSVQGFTVPVNRLVKISGASAVL